MNDLPDYEFTAASVAAMVACPLGNLGANDLERETFHLACREIGYNMTRTGYGSYVSKETRDAWNGWSMRANLVTRPKP